MTLEQKIKEICQRPEHIRMRFVWFFVSVSMFFVVIVWIFSLQKNFQALRTDIAPETANFGAELEKAIGSEGYSQEEGILPGAENTPQVAPQ